MANRWTALPGQISRPLTPFVCAICEDEKNTSKYPWDSTTHPDFRNDPPVCSMCAGRWGGVLGHLKPQCSFADLKALRILKALAGAIEWEALEQQRRARRGQGLPERPGERRARLDRDHQRARAGSRLLEIRFDDPSSGDGECGYREASVQRSPAPPDSHAPVVRLREGRNPARRAD